MFLVVTVTVTVAVLALGLPDIGGVAGMIEKAPSAHFNWGEIARPEFIALYIVGFSLTKLFEENSIDKSTKYLMSRSDRHARMTLIIPLAGTILGPLIWLVPPTVAAIRHPDIATLFPALLHPNEASFLLTASEVLPQGMLGLLVCGIFAATLTTMDAGLNQGAGIFVRNFYLPIVDPHCPERRLLLLSKAATGIFGLIMIAIGLLFNLFRETGLFDLVNQLAVSLTLPVVVPLFLGLFYKRTPSWSAWSTILIGLTGSFVVKFILTPESISWIPGLEGPYSDEETKQFYFFMTAVVVTVACVSWFFFTSRFYARSPAGYRAMVDEFFDRLRHPIPPQVEEEKQVEHSVGGSIGKLCLVYGGFVALLALIIPNTLQGRLSFAGCGGVMIVAGLYLIWHYRARKWV
jgi:Na+/proline symporter